MPAANRAHRKPVRREELSNLPTRKGRPGALQFFAEIGVSGVTDTRIRAASERGEVRRYTLGGHAWYADSDLFDWLQSLASGGRGGDA